MLINNRCRTTFITFILLFSLFSTCITFTDISKAEDGPFIIPEEYLEMFEENILSPHPFRFLATWSYDGNVSRTIEGDITFDLYFTSTVLTQLELEKYQDRVNVTIYDLEDPETATEIKNASKEFTLSPALLEERIQKETVKMENINHTINVGDMLLFVIEINQSDKLSSSYVAKQYEKLKSSFESIASRLNESDTTELKDIGLNLELFMDILDELDIKGEDLGELANVFTSSAFIYGSNTYDSSLKFSTSDSTNYTLYFHNNASNVDDLLGFGSIKLVSQSKPTGDDFNSYPPSIDTAILSSVDEEEWIMWFTIWALYNLGETPIDKEDYKTIYYLHTNDKMDENKPSGNASVQRDELTTSSITWKGPELPRNKMIENGYAEIYIHYPKFLSLSKPTISASLYDKEKLIAYDEKQLNQTTIFELLKRGPDAPIRFDFEIDEDYEIVNGNTIDLKVTLIDKPKLSLRPVNILYDSDIYQSSVTLYINETNNIQIEGIEDKLVYAGGSAHYALKINSVYEDTLEIALEGDVDNGKWEFDYPSEITVGENSTTTVDVYVNSTATDYSAYGDSINIFFNVTGKTGIDSKISNVKVSEKAVEYDIEVDIPEKIEVTHGHNKTFSLTIRNRNKGYYPDAYSIDITSQNGLNVTYIDYVGGTNDYLEIYDDKEKEPEAKVNITVYAEWYTDIKNDKLTIEITSANSDKYGKLTIFTYNVTVNVIQANILESIYRMFESAADSMGLGEYGAWILIIILLVIIFFFIIISLIIIKNKYVEIICLDRIKEITPDEKAEFDITIRNPKNRVMTYEAKTEVNTISKNWNISFDNSHVTVESRQSKIVKLYVEPNDFAKADDWIEVKVLVRPIDKVKTEEILTITSIKSAKLKVDISGLIHWPKNFQKGDRVETSFKINNRGNVSAENVTVILYINGEEKNKVENITIPRGGYADIMIPWIAEKGKNKVDIVVK